MSALMPAAHPFGNESLTRNIGLDAFRALAIVSVLIGHWMQHGQPWPWMRRWLGMAGVTGVELFFVLSGFLIGGIIVRLVRQEQLRSPTGLFRFWVKRWLRTLPLYFFFLIIWLHVDWRGPFSFSSYPHYFFFLQNFFAPTPAFFELSWSLAVEEWFYLLYPLVLLLLLNLRMSARRAIILTTLVFLTIPPLLRWHFIQPEHTNDLFTLVRVPVVFRLDSLMYGVGMAILADAAPRFWQWSAKMGPLWILLVIGLHFLCVTRLNAILSNPLTRTLLFSLFSLLAALTIPYATRIRVSAPLLRRLIVATSRWSYSIYLGHIVVIIFINNWISGWVQTGAPDSLLRWYVLYPVYAIATYALAALTFTLVEQPFLKWRDRIRWLSESSHGKIAMRATPS